MCFISSYKPKPLVAKTDIKCYKVVDKGYKGETVVYIPLIYHWSSKYRIGVQMPTVKLVPIRELSSSRLSGEVMIIHEGYHSYMPKQLKELKQRCFSISPILALFVIPRGTKYYIDREMGLYVSETIRMVKEVTCVS